MEKLKTFARVKPNLFRMYRRLSAHPNLYPRSPNSPGDVTMQPTTPQPPCGPEFQRWQPFASNAPGIAPKGSTSRKAGMKPNKVTKADRALQLTPMDVDQDNWLQTISQPMQPADKAAHQRQSPSGGLSLMGQLARLLRVSGSKAQPRETPNNVQPLTRSRGLSNPRWFFHEKPYHDDPSVHFGRFQQTRRLSLLKRKTPIQGNGMTSQDATTSQSSASVNGSEEPPPKKLLNVNKPRNQASSQTQTQSELEETENPPVIQHCDSRHNQKPYQPFWRIRISPKDPKNPIQSADALDFALREAPRAVRQHLAVSELALYVYVNPGSSPQPF